MAYQRAYATNNKKIIYFNNYICFYMHKAKEVLRNRIQGKRVKWKLQSLIN